MKELTGELKRDLILSVGTHKGKRALSPIEVAEGFKIALDSGMSESQIANMVLLNDATMIKRFIKLLKLSPNIVHLVDWGRASCGIPFSIASIIAGLDMSNQENLANAVLQHSLTKSEVNQIIQIKRNTGQPMRECIETVINMRPVIIKKHVFIGAIIEEDTIEFLDSIKQSERNKLFIRTLQKYISVDIIEDCRLGKKLFSITGGEELAKYLNKLSPSFETVINKWLAGEIQDEK